MSLSTTLLTSDTLSVGTTSFNTSILFGKGGKGVTFDLQDHLTLFQDHEGINSVTTYGQPVGLILDKSSALLVSSEIVTNSGNPFTTVMHWGSVNAKLSITNGNLKIENTSSIREGYAFATGAESGRWFRISFLVEDLSTKGYVSVCGKRIDFEGTGLKTFAFFVPLNVEDNRIHVGLNSKGLGDSLQIRNISVKELKGHHAYQEVSSKRPILGRRPVTGTRNLLSYSHDFNNSLWPFPGTTRTPKQLASSGALTATKFSGTSTAASRRVLPAVKKAGSYTYTICLKSENNSKVEICIRNDTLPLSYQVGTLDTNLGTISGAGWTCVPKPNGFYECSFTIQSISVNTVLSVYYGTSGPSTDPKFEVTIDYAQLEYGPRKTTIQKVDSYFDVTEEGVSSVNYLKFDGIDDYLETKTLDLGSTGEATLVASVSTTTTTKSSIASLGSSVLADNTLSLLTNTSTFEYNSVGNIPTTSKSVNTFDSSSNVIIAKSSIKAGVNTLNVNGSIIDLDYSQGDTEEYIKAPLYLGGLPGSLPFNGELYSLTLIGGLLPKEEVKLLETSLWGHLGRDNFTPKDLFRNGEEGIWYDPNDLETMYSLFDRFDPLASPVKSVDQPVSLLLNKSTSAIDMTSALDNPTLVGPSTKLGTRLFNLKADASVPGLHGINIPVTPGLYELDFDVVRVGAGSGTIRIDTGDNLSKNYDLISGQNYKLVLLKYLPSLSLIRVADQALDVDIQFNSLTCITKHSAYQAASSKRPILKKNSITGYNYLSFDGVDDYLRTSNINLSHTSDLTVVAVVQRKRTKDSLISEFSSNALTMLGGHFLASPPGPATPLGIGTHTKLTNTLKTSVVGFSTKSLPALNVITSINRISNKESLLYVDSSRNFVSTSDTPTFTYGTHPLYLACRSGNAYFFQGDIYSYIFLDRAITEEERYHLEKYLRKQIDDPTIDVVSLFRNGEQGVYYDFNDIDTIYEDTLGKRPVTTNQQPVGLVLDKSKESINDLAFNVGILPGHFSINSTETYLKVIGAENTRTTEWFGVDPSTSYRMFTEISDRSRVQVRSSTGRIDYLDSSNDNPVNKTIFTTLEDTVAMRVYFASSALNANVKDFAVQRVSGTHAMQKISSKRPTLQRDASTGIYTIKFDGLNDTLQTSNLDLSHTDNITVIAALKKSGDAASYACAVGFGRTLDQPGSFALSAPFASASKGFGVEYNTNSKTSLEISGVPSPSNILTSTTLDSTKSATLKFGETLLQKTVTDGGKLGSYRLSLGMQDGTDLPFDGEISSIMIIDRSLSSEEIQLVEKSFNRYLVSTAFSPKDFFKRSERGFYFDPNDLSTMFQDDSGTIPVVTVGQPVGCIVDKANGLKAVQVSSSKRPILRRNKITDSYYLSFDGIDDFLQVSSVTLNSSDKFSLFIAVTPTGVRADSTIIELGTNSDSKPGLGFFQSIDGLFHYNSNNGITTGAMVSSPTRYVGKVSEVLTGITDLRNNSKTLYVGKDSDKVVDKSVQGTGNIPSLPLFIGMRDGVISGFSGDIYGIVGIDRVLSLNDTRAVQNHFHALLNDEFRIEDLFKDGSKGLYFDPNDLSTMFRSGNGVHPVTAAGQEVGLILDKSRNLTYGPNLVSNPKFVNGVTGWLTSGKPVVTVNDNGLSIIGNGSSGGVYQYLQTSGGLCEVIIKFKSTGLFTISGYTEPSLTTNSTTQAYSQQVTNNQYETLTFFIQSSSPAKQIGIYFQNASATTEVIIKEVSVREVNGCIGIQSTANRMPLVLKDDMSKYNYLSFDGIDDSLVIDTTGMEDSEEVTIVAALRTYNKNSSGTILEYSDDTNTSAGSFGLFSPFGKDDQDVKVLVRESGTTPSLSTPLLKLDDRIKNFLATIVINFKKSIVSLTVDGIVKTVALTSTEGKLGKYKLYLGSRAGIGLLPFKGDIFALFMINKQLLSSDIAKIEDKFKDYVTTEFELEPLFADGEQGCFYDPNDLTTLYQDAAGITPVTGAGQAVGLVLDKSKGLALGGEMVDKAIVPSSWRLFGANTATSPDVNTVSLNYVDSTTLGLLPLSAAKTLNTDILNSGWYEVSLDIKVPNNQVWVQVSSVSNNKSYLITPLESYQRVTWKILTGAPVPQIHVYGSSGSMPTNAIIKNISVKKLAGNHAYQTTSSCRPILRYNEDTGYNYLEFDGVDDGYVTPSIDFSKTDKVTVITAVRKLSDAQTGILLELGANYTNAFRVLAPDVSNTYGFRSGGGAVTFVSASGYTSPTSSVVTCKNSISSNKLSISVNAGTPITNTASQGGGLYRNDPLNIGRRSNNALPFNGQIYALLVIGKLLNDATTANIEKEFAKYIGVTL